MVREYIGARYVPKFMETYDVTQAYEALCVVDNGMGTSYITKVPTPAGTPLTDTNYYAVYGASSGAIINLQNQIDKLNTIVVTPQRFGAVGDGATDDTQAFKDALQAADGFMFIPNGEYLLTESINVPDNIYIMCEGTIKDSRPGAETDIIGLFDLNNVENVILDGVNIVGSGAISTYIVGGVIVARNQSKHITIRNCSVEETPFNYAITTYGYCDDVIVDNCHVKRFSYGGITNVNSSDNFIVKNCLIEDGFGFSNANTYPISLSLDDNNVAYPYRETYNLTADNNTIVMTTDHWEGIDAHYGNNVVITNNIIENSRSGIALAGGQTRNGQTLEIHNFVMSNNILKGPGTAGTATTSLCEAISAAHSYDGIISNNVISGFAEKRDYNNSCIIYIVGSDDIKIDGNEIKGGAKYNNNTSYVMLFSASDKIVASNNKMTSGTNTSVFRVEACTEIIMKDNYIRNCATTSFASSSGVPTVHYYRLVNNNSDILVTNEHFVGEIQSAGNMASVITGRYGDIIKNYQLAVGSPIGWICTSSQVDANTPATWVALPNL